MIDLGKVLDVASLGLTQLRLQALDLLVSFRNLLPHPLLYFLMHRIDSLRVPLPLFLNSCLELFFLSFIEFSELLESFLTTELSLAKLILMGCCRGLKLLLEALDSLLLLRLTLRDGLQTLCLQGPYPFH